MSVIYFPQLGFLQSFPLTAQGLEGLGLEFQFTTEVTAYYKSSRMRGSFCILRFTFLLFQRIHEYFYRIG